ncbi:MAG: hypothetical protein GXX79_03320 [Actinomycetales bacterium]|nr:hypothetical protein [Actinomycetales bacterium]
MAEVWQRDRWVMVDAQLDEIQREVLGITFDPLDVPNDLFADPGAVAGDSLPPEGSLLPVETQQFLVAGRAWQLCRSGAVDPQRFGIFDSRGEEFVAGNVVRDALALNSVEILPWDMWGAMPVPGGDRADAMDRPFLDRLAELAISADATWAELRELYAAEPRLHTLPRWVTDPEPFHARHPADWS